MVHEPVGPSSALGRCNLGGEGISVSATLLEDLMSPFELTQSLVRRP